MPVNYEEGDDRVVTLTLDAPNWFAHNGEALLFTDDMVLVDGQHRMLAVIKYGKPVWFLCTFGVDPATCHTHDRGKSRSITTVSTMAGTKNAAVLKAAAHCLITLRANVDPESKTGRRHDPAARLDTVAAFHAFLDANPLLRTFVPVNHTLRKVFLESELVACACEFALVESESLAREWLRGLQGGLRRDDPRQCLRDRIMEDRVQKNGARFRVLADTRIRRMDFMVQSWNLWIGGHRRDRLQAG